MKFLLERYPNPPLGKVELKRVGKRLCGAKNQSNLYLEKVDYNVLLHLFKSGF